MTHQTVYQAMIKAQEQWKEQETQDSDPMKHHKMMMLTHHKVSISESKLGVLSISITPCNDVFFDVTAILHDVNERVIRISSIRKVKEV